MSESDGGRGAEPSGWPRPDRGRRTTPAMAPPIAAEGDARGHHAGERPGGAERLRCGGRRRPSRRGRGARSRTTSSTTTTGGASSRRWSTTSTTVSAAVMNDRAADEHDRRPSGVRDRPASRSAPRRARPARPSGRRPRRSGPSGRAGPRRGSPGTPAQPSRQCGRSVAIGRGGAAPLSAVPVQLQRVCVYCGSSRGADPAYADAAAALGAELVRPGHRPRVRRRLASG